MNRRTVAWVAVSLGSLNVAFSLLSLHFAGLNDYSLALYLEELILPAAILAVSFSVVGVLVASHRPRNPLGWIFLAVGFSQGLVQFAGTYAEYVLVTEPGFSLPGAPMMSWLGRLDLVSGVWPAADVCAAAVPQRTVAFQALAALKAHKALQNKERLMAGSLWQDNDLEFTSTVGTPVDVGNLTYRSFRPLLKRAGLPQIPIHDLRHTAATLLLVQGVHPKVVQEMLGHSTITQTMDTYSHVLPDMQEGAVMAMEEAMSSEEDPEPREQGSQASSEQCCG